MKRLVPLKVFALSALLSACVTINVYFPAAAAEKAADKVINEVWGDQAKKPADKETGSNIAVDTEHSVLLAAAGSVLDFLISPAHADADLNVSTPAVRQVTQSMQARSSQLKPYYDSGAVGLTSDGLIEVRDQNVIPLPERNQVRKLVGDDNADRNTLYREIAAGNGHPEWEAQIRKTFAQQWIQRAPSGWYVQDAGGWRKK
jgi:uncharacterized protein